ncbi:ABC transporter ATP-binding protein [Halomontanus rarus]|uniref:ABC transporter ATP-binding protein n=1 Tax=Halomontanus rarus TaxID=3034020 RepID=UPI0023E8C1A8|nr:ABC transporter ATP-binding protein [Halovivax sp. TS33]
MAAQADQIESMSEPDTILSVRDTDVIFDMERGESKVLNGVSMDVKRGEILGVVGESGSGKSMFASAMLDAVVDPGQLSGSIRYFPNDGVDEYVEILSLSKTALKKLRWEEISMVFQGAMSSFNPTMSLREHFVETLDAHNADQEAGLERTRELLSDLYLEPDRVLSSYPHELSGGMRQRALIALSLVLEPEVLVMDEPTAALDLLMQRSILTLLEDLKEKYDLTVVFITHDLPLVAGLADRLAVMYAFEFVEVGPSNDLIRNAAHPYTRSLLKAVPNLNATLGSMRPIEGRAPDPVNVPSGCSYHPRCPVADRQCEEAHPALEKRDTDHPVACFYPERSRDQIEYVLDTGESYE